MWKNVSGNLYFGLYLLRLVVVEKKNTYNSILVAKYMLALAFERNIVLNVTKVQKMLYILYGYFIARGVKILDEQPKAWPYGPVFPKTRKKVDFNIVWKTDNPDFKDLVDDKDLTDILNKVIEKYSGYTATQLTEWSHMSGGPWEETTKQEGFDWNAPIPDEYIASYFKELNV